MKTFVLELQSCSRSEEIVDVISFVGEDASGSFGIMAGHDWMMTSLQFGLSWFRHNNGEIEYLAMPGGLLHFINNRLLINTRSYLRSFNYQEIAASLDQKLNEENQNISELKNILHNLDKGILEHLLEMKRAEAI